MDELHRRGKALEDKFFKIRDNQLLAEYKAELASQEIRDELRAVSGIDEETTLTALALVGITRESLSSISLIPLVTVAWSDGKMEDKERAAILQAADQSGIKSGSVSYALLDGWLNQQPGGELLSAWKDYITSLKGSLDTDAFAQLKAIVIGRAANVARASGGLLGLGNKISVSEEKVIEDLSNAF